MKLKGWKMRLETMIGTAIRVTGTKARYDAACKRLLSQKVILARILKECAAEYGEYSVEEISQRFIEEGTQVNGIALEPDGVAGGSTFPSAIRGERNEDVSLAEGTVLYDIRFCAIVPHSGQRLLIDLEAQNEFHPGYSLTKRAAYYEGRMISAQRGTEFEGSDYDELKKVYSIWVCMEPPGELRNTITVISNEQKPLVGEMKFLPREYDLMSTVIICLGDPDGERSTGVLRLLNVLLSVQIKVDEKKYILENEFNIPMTQELEEEVSTMCNLSEGVERRGIQKGLQQGLQQGIQQGLQQGIQRGIQQGIRAMVIDNIEEGVSREKICEKLCHWFELPMEEAQAYVGRYDDRMRS